MILALKHMDIEGPGTAGDFFIKQGFEIKIIELYNGDALPKKFDNVEAVLVLGGPMNVYEEKKFTFLTKENEFIQKILRAEIPYLGFCLGAQLLAKASGLKVISAPEKEIGMYTIKLTQQGLADPLFKGIGKEFHAFQWHEDMVETGRMAQPLAYSESCECQTIKIGSNAYGLQFHVEITNNDVRNWIEEYLKANDKVFIAKKKQLLDDYLLKKLEIDQTADVIYKNFSELIKKN